MDDDRVTFADRRFVLEAVVFVSAAVGMMLELAGSRLMAPYFGNSLFVWTSLIGVILAFMSLGNYIGGRLADRWVDATMLSWVLAIASLGVVVMSFSERRFLPALVEMGSIRTMSVVAACLLFAVPSVLLGVVTPYSTRIRVHGMAHAGATIGRLYAMGTIGSIVGTFAAGFWLISVLGTHSLILLCAAVLGLLALPVMGRLDWRKLAVLALALALGFYSAVRADADEVALDTQYDRYMLRTATDPASGRPLVGLSRDFISAESASYADTGEPFAFEYYAYYDLAAELTGADRVLLVGGGTFSYPRIFLAGDPDATIDVVEIDGELVAVAEEHFGFVRDERMPLYLEDGRTFLNRAGGPYDVVLLDAFKSESTVPYQLTTVESWQRCYDVLDDDGILVMNVIASPTDERAKFFHALMASIERVFPHVEAFAVQGAAGADDPLQNTSIVAAKNPGIDLAAAIEAVAPELAARRIAGYEVPEGTRPLTDDFAPVDQYLMGL
jgi:predicted membrane-bound spermidine synthase